MIHMFGAGPQSAAVDAYIYGTVAAITGNVDVVVLSAISDLTPRFPQDLS